MFQFTVPSRVHPDPIHPWARSEHPSGPVSLEGNGLWKQAQSYVDGRAFRALSTWNAV